MPSFVERRCAARIAFALLAGLLLALPSRSLGAQGAPGSDAYVSAGRLHALTDSLARAAQAAGRPIPGRALAGDDTSFALILLRRDTSGAPEVHAEWADVFVVQAGRATVIVGGLASGATEMARGEWRGGRIGSADTTTGARAAPVMRRLVGPGDVLIIPAGVPHQVEVARGESLTYLVAKVAARPAGTR